MMVAPVNDLVPDRAAMIAHLEHLFGGFIEDADGLIEIAWTADKPHPVNGKYALQHTRLFGTDQIEEAADFAVEINSQPMRNVYVGGALRKPETPHHGRTSDDDVLATTAVWADLDSEDSARSAKVNYSDLKPTFIVMTGTHPHNRVQCWWKLSENITDPARLRNLLSGIAHRMGGDTSVVNPSRVMRLAGTIAWPQKEGRVTELTRVIPLREPGLQAYLPEHVERIFPPVHSLAAHREKRQADGGDGTILRERGALGLNTGKITDGRERYMRDVILANLVELAGQHGLEPDGNDLFEAAWPVYQAKVSFDRPGRGEAEFREKCAYTARRFVEGKIPGLRSVEEAAQAFQTKRAAKEACGPVPKIDDFDFGTPDAPASERFRFETIEDLRKLPPAKWLVKDWVPEGGTGILYGKWATGKSFISFDLALHLAYGFAEWHGTPLPEGGVDVLVIAREGHQGFVQRIDAFKKHHGIVEDTDRLHFMRGAVSFMKDEEFVGLCQAIKAQPVQYRLVVIDTVARVLAGVDMNAQETVTAFMERCSAISDISGAAAIGVHHQNKAGSMMGSVYFEANADFVFEVSREVEDEENPGPLRVGQIVCTKMKDGEDGWKRAIRYENVGLTEESGSLVVAEMGGAPAVKAPSLPPRDTCRRILNAIDEAWRSGHPFSNARQTQREGKYAPRVLARQFNVPANQIETLILDWIGNDIVVVEIANRNTKAKGLKVVGRID